MMGPDYTQWHGLFEVAERFYHELVPELREVIELTRKQADERETGGEPKSIAVDAAAPGSDERDGVATAAERAAVADELERRLEEILESDMHRWVLGEMSEGERAARRRAAEEFRRRYAQ
jgi:hypothetical protein